MVAIVVTIVATVAARLLLLFLLLLLQLLLLLRLLLLLLLNYPHHYWCGCVRGAIGVEWRLGRLVTGLGGVGIFLDLRIHDLHLFDFVFYLFGHLLLLV